MNPISFYKFEFAELTLFFFITKQVGIFNMVLYQSSV
jgi:hypothetical protein